MSRSYKKVPCIKGNQKEEKKFANEKVRRKTKDLNENIQNGMFYKKYYEAYDICDWKISYSFNSYKFSQETRNKRIINREYNFVKRYEIINTNTKDFYKKWYISYKAK